MHSAIQTAAVTTISYEPLSDLNFARYTQHYIWQLHALFSFGGYKPLILPRCSYAGQTSVICASILYALSHVQMYIIWIQLGISPWYFGHSTPTYGIGLRLEFHKSFLHKMLGCKFLLLHTMGILVNRNGVFIHVVASITGDSINCPVWMCI